MSDAGLISGTWASVAARRPVPTVNGCSGDRDVVPDDDDPETCISSPGEKSNKNTAASHNFLEGPHDVGLSKPPIPSCEPICLIV